MIEIHFMAKKYRHLSFFIVDSYTIIILQKYLRTHLLKEIERNNMLGGIMFNPNFLDNKGSCWILLDFLLFSNNA